eukprot:SAG31_NODE_580_length_13940_cov_16.175349_12_plen_86_part_00
MGKTHQKSSAGDGKETRKKKKRSKETKEPKEAPVRTGPTVEEVEKARKMEHKKYSAAVIIQKFWRSHLLRLRIGMRPPRTCAACG